MIVRAAVCPSPPLLARQLTGQADVFPELRTACAAAVSTLLAAAPDVVVVAGAGLVTATWDPDDRLDPSAYAPALGTAGKPGLPLALGLGAMLLDAAGHAGPQVLQGDDDGHELRDARDRQLLVGVRLREDLAVRRVDDDVRACVDRRRRSTGRARQRQRLHPAMASHRYWARCPSSSGGRWRSCTRHFAAARHSPSRR